MRGARAQGAAARDGRGGSGEGARAGEALLASSAAPSSSPSGKRIDSIAAYPSPALCRIPGRSRLRRCSGNDRRVPVARDVSPGHGHGRRRALRADTRAMDRRHVDGALSVGELARSRRLRRRRPDEPLRRLVAPGSSQLDGRMFRHRDDGPRGARSLRGDGGSVRRIHESRYGGQRGAHATRAGRALLLPGSGAGAALCGRVVSDDACGA